MIFILINNVCEWGNIDCKNINIRCYNCFTNNLNYYPPQKKSPKVAKRGLKASGKRKGTKFEDKNHVATSDLINGVSTRMTPNSGAGFVKGDEEIRGIINIMEELKQQNRLLAKGDKSFSMKLSWLRKLSREAKIAGKEFWYLKFSYGDDVPETFITIDEEVIMSMVFSMIEDRKSKKQAELNTNMHKKRIELIETENIKLSAEIEYLKAKIKKLEYKGIEFNNN